MAKDVPEPLRILPACDLRGNVREIEAAAEPRIRGITKLSTDVFTRCSVGEVLAACNVLGSGTTPPPSGSVSLTPSRASGSGSTDTQVRWLRLNACCLSGLLKGSLQIVLLLNALGNLLTHRLLR